MKCPFCNFEEDKVVDSRSTKEGKAIRRRRECLKCGKRYTTYEYIESVPRTVLKKNGNREPYDMGKLVTGLYTACKKRPVPPNRIQEIGEEIENKISNLKMEEIPSKIIGDYVMEALQKVDEVAYMRFASVCRNFNEVSEFLTEINDMNAAQIRQETNL
ncbi:transcriptional regulator NrdR [Fibrobacterota bacterium]